MSTVFFANLPVGLFRAAAEVKLAQFRQLCQQAVDFRITRVKFVL
ncbi:hypothetical protein [Brenneria salicis]|nr:hypothetical protein [Brenneria salicis]